MSLTGPSELSSLPELLARRAGELGDTPVFIYLLEGEAEAATLSFGALRRRTETIAAFLRGRYASGSRSGRSVWCG
ncbi:hypothetical protein WME89_41125 [Sorangium sp. So ce321]|uniref:hypothetical protein n=1 Tax=Sorangium sp. So ce321 TaxID=3133300 RepID=UPI003F5DEE86